MNFMKFPKAIFLDLDGTILDTEALYLKIMMNYNKKNMINISKKFYINNFLGKSKEEISNIFQSLAVKNYDEKSYWDGLLQYRKECLNINGIKKKEGFVELIKYLKRNECYIGIVTSNSKKLVNELLLLSNIKESDFNLIVCREDAKSIKPNSDLYEYAIKKSGIKKDNIVVIEDSNVGVQASLNAGLITINIKDIANVDEKLKEKCYTTISSLYDLIKILDRSGGKNGNN